MTTTANPFYTGELGDLCAVIYLPPQLSTTVSSYGVGGNVPDGSPCIEPCQMIGGMNGPDGICNVDCHAVECMDSFGVERIYEGGWGSCAPVSAPAATASSSGAAAGPSAGPQYTRYSDTRCSGRGDICGPDEAPCSRASGETACTDACSADDNCVSATSEPDGACHLSTTCLPWAAGNGNSGLVPVVTLTSLQVEK